MYLHIKKEAFCINYDKVLLLVLCSVVFANYIYISMGFQPNNWII